MSRIFVQIASYRDKYIFNTVETAHTMARRPKRVRYGICLQDTFEHFNDLREVSPAGCKIIWVDYHDSLGMGWARIKARSLYDGEDYELQIDSHMQFTKDWDVNLIDCLKSCPSAKPVVSHYCPEWHRQKLKEQFPCTITPWAFSDIDCLRLCESGFDARTNPPTVHPYISGHFLFAEHNFFEEVPLDPKVGFGFEEGSLSVRAWTSGWDIFAPNKIIARHTWRRNRPLAWNDSPAMWDNDDKVAQARWRRLVRIEGKPLRTYGLGKTRTLRQYERFSGLNFKNRKILDEAKWTGKVNTDY